MPTKKSQVPDPILPTPMEEHDGEIIDPRGHEEKIGLAVATLSNFAKDMVEGRLPTSTLTQVREAVETLGHFAGYPADAHRLGFYLESEYAPSSYSEVASLVGPYTEDMASRIRTRIAMLNAPTPGSPTKSGPEEKDDDCPF